MTRNRSPQPRTSIERRQKLRNFSRCTTRTVRKGLAPLEFVLVIPLLLFVMALMINYGTVAGWRVRALGMSRHAAWQSRHPRSMSRSPRPDYWPASANVDSGGAADAPSLDFPAVDLPVVRGPTVGDFGVRSGLLDPSRGIRRGSASMDRDFPLLPSMGPYHLR
ncbi:MAG: pilus assembly protein, partial [Planctomycetota bacterium]